MRGVSMLLALVMVPFASIASAQSVGPAAGDPAVPSIEGSVEGVVEQADAIEERMRGLRRSTGELGSEINQSYLRLAAIELSMRGETGGARVTITQHNHVGPFFRLVEASYAIDGAPVFHEADESGRLGGSPLEVHGGAIAPGAHVLSVTLRYVGAGGALFSYVEGYRFVVRSSHSFVVPDGQRMRVGIDAYEHAERAYTERLDVIYREQLEQLE